MIEIDTHDDVERIIAGVSVAELRLVETITEDQQQVINEAALRAPRRPGFVR